MGVPVHDPKMDLFVPIPDDYESIDPHLIHTHFFNFLVPEAGIGGHIYIRWQPAFKLCQGGVVIYRGTGNVEQLDAQHLNWQNTMRWPTIVGNTITTPNGLSVEFIDPGRVVRLRYQGAGASFDLLQTAISPLAVRAHVLPGEAERADPASAPGGLEQYMKCEGTLTLGAETFDVSCFSPRDRSWNQVRTEKHDAIQMPPIAWTPMSFGPDLSFNQVGFEHPDTNPPYLADYPFPADRPTHVYGWVHSDGVTNHLESVHREVHRRHPASHIALEQTIAVRDEDGREFRFEGEAIAYTVIPAWPNIANHDALYRWTDDKGRTTHATCQEGWFDKYQHRMNSLTTQRFAAQETRV